MIIFASPISTRQNCFLEVLSTRTRNVIDLLNADYTFLNERLARQYGIPGIYGSEFRRAQDYRRKPTRSIGAGKYSDGDLLWKSHFRL